MALIKSCKSSATENFMTKTASELATGVTLPFTPGHVMMRIRFSASQSYYGYAYYDSDENICNWNTTSPGSADNLIVVNGNHLSINSSHTIYNALSSLDVFFAE